MSVPPSAVFFYGPPTVTLATTAGATSAALFADPLLALALSVSSALLGVTAAAWRNGDVTIFSRRFAGNLLVAGLAGLAAFAYFETRVENNLVVVVMAGLLGLFLDVVIALVGEALQTWLLVLLKTKTRGRHDRD